MIRKWRQSASRTLTLLPPLNQPAKDAFYLINKYILVRLTEGKLTELCSRGLWDVGLEWTAARRTCPCRYEKGKGGRTVIGAVYIWPEEQEEQPIRRAFPQRSANEQLVSVMMLLTVHQ